MTTLALGVVHMHMANPFTNLSIVTPTHQIETGEGQDISVDTLSTPILLENKVVRDIALLEQGVRIANNVYTGSPEASGMTVDQIIGQIHTLRFNPQNPYLISGDHFSILYPRSLGIFYHSLLDPRTALEETDWRNRQSVYLKTTAYALDVFAQSDELSTSIVPLGGRFVTLANFFTTPSDTLYSLLYALDVLQDSSFLRTVYPFTPKKGDYQLSTKQSAIELTEKHQETLRRHFKKYLETVQDPKTKLVRTDIFLSSTKDSTKRQSAFYDNVILWRTKQLAQKLAITPPNQDELDVLKEKILATYWDEKQGYFKESLSQTGSRYSSDWLIVLMTGFLNPRKATESHYFTSSIAYIKTAKIDHPFPLRYQLENDREDQYELLKLMAPSYAGEAVWSNWGMEYIKLLTILGVTQQNPAYLADARQYLDQYTENILKFRGYPEVYDKNGEIFISPAYKSVRQTGWVVSYEQARAMLDDVLLPTLPSF